VSPTTKKVASKKAAGKKAAAKKAAVRRIKPDPSKSVFINFPYDDKFDRLLNAIFFAAVCCGFVPRSALEWNEEGGPRIPRIMNGLDSSKYSIHDLSRYQGEGEEKLARFNMPLELGMAVALSHVKKGEQTPHRWLALVPEGELHHKVISDLSGYDQNVKKYDGAEKSVAQKVYVWLTPFPDAIDPPPSFADVLAALEEFQQKVKQQQEEYGEKRWEQMLDDARRLVPRL
jgi:hypothetical protein